MISKEVRRVLRSEPNVHDVDGACFWTAVTQKVRRMFPNIDPEEWWEHF